MMYGARGPVPLRVWCSARPPEGSSRLSAVPGVDRDVHRTGAQNGETLLEDLFELLSGAPLHQHVPMRTRGLGLLLLGAVAVHQECLGTADLALPLRRDLRL